MKFETAIRESFVVTQTSGDEFLVMCPFHEDTSSGHMYVNGVKGLYLCHSCGAKGSLEDLDIPRIVVGSDDVREKIRRIRSPKQQQQTYPESWLKQYDFNMVRDYWGEERELPEAVVRRFCLGYDPMTDRATMPLRDSRGRILGVTYRRLDDGKPKYLHPKGFPTGRHLYGAWLLTNETTVALVEGQVDAVRGWAARVPALAAMGARLTRDQVRVLQRLNVRCVVVLFDNDAAGTKGTLQVIEALKGSGIRVKVGWYRDYWHGIKDPDGLTHQRYRKFFHSAEPATAWASRVAGLR